MREKMTPNYPLYETLKWQWVQTHPNSTPEEYQQAMKRIAKECGV